MFRRIAVAAGCLWLVVGSAHAGAFGIDMGTPVSTLKVVDTVEADGPLKGYSVVPPLPNSEFESYLVLATKETGVCKVIGLGKIHENDSSGDDVKADFKGMLAALSGKYGEPTSYDFLRDGALWSRENDWAASINQNERVLVSFWSPKASASQTISIVQLEVDAQNLHDTYLKLVYEFSNFETCQQIKQAEDDRGL